VRTEEWRDARQPKKVQAKTLEQRLWETADALRGNQEPSEYKHVVLGLVFLKYISDRFEARRKDIRATMRAKVRRLLAKYDYPPDLEAKAVELVLEQAELLATEGTA